MPVSSRTVWYFHGFDPATTARYRRIFAAASERFDVTLEGLPDGEDGWQATREGVVTDVRYCRYEDLVRGYRAAPFWQRAWRYWVTLFAVSWSSIFARPSHQTSKAYGLMLAPMMTFGFPIVLLAVCSFWLGMSAILALFVGALLGLLLVRWLFLDVVADLFSYLRALAVGNDQHWSEYAMRIYDLADQIDPGETDETLVIGHSLGGIAAVVSVARKLETWPEGRPIGLLTLGSTHGIVLAQLGIGQSALVAAIQKVTSDPRVFWVDVSSPRDAFCVPLTDPLKQIGQGARPGMTSPRVISAQLRDAPKIPGDRRTVFSAMRRHMGYLLAPEPGSGFDYADTVTAALSLKERFGPRGNSPKAKMWQG
ncbi:MAG: hypothetical protein AAF557_02560 [Pseudomonadota bacterium]